MEKRFADITIWIYAVIFWIKALILFLVGLAFIFLTPFAVKMLMSEANAADLPPWPPGALESLAGGLGVILGIIFVLFAALFVVTGIGLVKRRNWSRLVVVIFSAFDLLSFPFGTIIGAFGIYAFGFDTEMRRQFQPESLPVVQRAKAKRAAKKKK